MLLLMVGYRCASPLHFVARRLPLPLHCPAPSSTLSWPSLRPGFRRALAQRPGGVDLTFSILFYFVLYQSDQRDMACLLATYTLFGQHTYDFNVTCM
jgi:hypothetical protein